MHGSARQVEVGRELAGLASRRRLSSILRSPYVQMSLWIVPGVLLYLLGWSDLLSPLRTDTLLFLAVVAVGYLALAQRFPSPLPHTVESPRQLNFASLGLITAYFLGAYVKNGGIPLLQLLTGGEYDVYGFGVDGLHVAMLCFTGYYGVRSFRVLLHNRRLIDLVAFIWVAALLSTIANRSAVSYLAFACALVLLLSLRLRPVWLVALGAAALMFAFGFGVFGDIRLARQIEDATGVPAGRDAILLFAKATESFDETGLSPSWLWFYTYFVSPLANLNSAVEYSVGSGCQLICNVPGLVTYELLPDAIGVRIADALSITAVDPGMFLIADDVTASTMFGSAVAGSGLVGGLAVAAALACVVLVSMRLLRGTAFAIEGSALLGTIVFFGFFENMLAYTALFGQLVIVLVRGALDRTKFFGASQATRMRSQFQ